MLLRRLDTINESTGSILSSDRFSYDKIEENTDDGANRVTQSEVVNVRNGSGDKRISDGKRQLTEIGRKDDSSGSKRSKMEVGLRMVSYIMILPEHLNYNCILRNY